MTDVPPAQMANLDLMSGRQFESVMFRGPYIEVSYTEPYDRGDGVTLYRTMSIEASKIREQHQDLLRAVMEFVDEGFIALRNPPATIPNRRPDERPTDG